MKRLFICYLALVLTIAGLCPAMVGCASQNARPAGAISPEAATQTLITDPTRQTIEQQPTEETTLPAETQSNQTEAQDSDKKTGKKPSENPSAEKPAKEEKPTAAARNVDDILKSTLKQLAKNVPEPNFGTLVGEWTVLCLARGGYFKQNDSYFADYYSRIEAVVAQKAESVKLNGALHKAKSTENSRLIVALSAIGKDATSVGGWNLIAPYDDFGWIKKQGINGPIWALIALDAGNYQTKDTGIRQQCLDYILQRQLSDGGWALTGKVSDPDITAMTLQALYPYRGQTEVKKAAEKGFSCLCALQKKNGGYVTFGDDNSESCAQVVVACATWGINPDTDARFIKNGVSVLDAMLTYYVNDEAGFKHIQSGKVDAMATDQGCYALIAYQRLLNGNKPLYDMRDVSG